MKNERPLATITDLSSYRHCYEVSKLRVIAWLLFSRVFINTYFLWPMDVKVVILKLFGANIGKGLVIKPKISIKYPWNVNIGNNVWLGERLWIDSLDQVKIGDNVCISQGAFLITGSHNYKLSSFDLITKPINIENGVWISANAVVCPGVSCREHSVLSVGSVASNDLNAFSVYQGNPAVFKRVREIGK